MKLEDNFHKAMSLLGIEPSQYKLHITTVQDLYAEVNNLRLHMGINCAKSGNVIVGFENSHEKGYVKTDTTSARNIACAILLAFEKAQQDGSHWAVGDGLVMPKKLNENVSFEHRNGVDYRVSVNAPVSIDINSILRLFENAMQTRYLAYAQTKFSGEDNLKFITSACQRELRNKLDKIRSKLRVEVISFLRPNHAAAPLNFLEVFGDAVTPVEW